MLVLKAQNPMVLTAQSVPKDITPLSFWFGIPASAENLDAQAFMVAYGSKAAAELANAGIGPTQGCTVFAPIRVEDRPEVKVASQGGRGIPRKRERQFIVHALGWKAEGRTN